MLLTDYLDELSGMKPDKKDRAPLVAPEANQALHFLRELRNARSVALADAEGWQSLIFAFERLAKYITRDQFVTVGSMAASDAFKLVVERAQADKLSDNDPFWLLLKQVVDGRNSEFHGGAAARRFAKHCVEFSFLLEEGLSNFMNKNLGSVMSSPVVEIELWRMLADLRRLMLENSYTWIPLKTSEGWKVVSDHALVSYLKVHQDALKTQTVEQALSPGGLEAATLKLFCAKTEIRNEELMKALARGPVLVCDGEELNVDRVVGIVTSFDLL
ncbi:MAG: hypothetical protein H7343_15375 [Undibacterium sp.]|nr:hypothetical protein [Opitutaceae bacterium]